MLSNGVFYTDNVIFTDDYTGKFDWKGNILRYVHRYVCDSYRAGNIWRIAGEYLNLTIISDVI